MKKLRRRAISLILSVVMILSMMPAISWATVTEPNETEWIQGIIAQLEMEGYVMSVKTKIGSTDVYMYIYSKSIWDEDAQNFEQDSVFIFQSGNGAVNSEIPGYENELESRPWAKANPSAVYIADGVTGIGSHAFDTISTLNKLEIEDPASLTYVGDHAFQNCNKLTGPIDLSGVTNMGEAAFYGCSRLQKVTLGEGLQTIPDNAFNACGLTQIQIPKNITSIGDSAFANNGFREQPNGTLTLHEGLKTIGSNAFYIQPNSTEATSGFQTLVIPCTVTAIGDGAFSMTYPDVVTNVRYDMPVINVVFTNTEYGFIKNKYEDTNEYNFGVDFTDVDYAKVGEAQGAVGLTVNRIEDIDRVMQEAVDYYKQGRVVVVDAKITKDRPIPVETLKLDTNLYSDDVVADYKAKYEAEDLVPFREYLEGEGLTSNYIKADEGNKFSF